jgi:hypothetical protein
MNENTRVQAHWILTADGRIEMRWERVDPEPVEIETPLAA